MLFMRRGDHGPMVAAVQVLLNRCALGQPLGVDGLFGPITQRAVAAFQASHRVPGRAGVVDPGTWLSLSQLFRVAIVDAVDVYDPEHDELMPDEMRGPGLVATGGMSNGVESIVTEVIERARSSGRLALLRFQGHGGPGLMSTSAGTGSLRDMAGRVLYRCRIPAMHSGAAALESASCPPGPKGKNAVKFKYYDEQSVISDRNFFKLESALGRLRPHFAEFGSIELHGCRIARDKRGRSLLGQLSQAVGVPVSAGLDYQYFARISDPHAAFRFEGRVVSHFPAAGGLRQWAQSLAQAEAGAGVSTAQA